MKPPCASPGAGVGAAIDSILETEPTICADVAAPGFASI